MSPGHAARRARRLTAKGCVANVPEAQSERRAFVERHALIPICLHRLSSSRECLFHGHIPFRNFLQRPATGNDCPLDPCGVGHLRPAGRRRLPSVIAMRVVLRRSAGRRRSPISAGCGSRAPRPGGSGAWSTFCSCQGCVIER